MDYGDLCLAQEGLIRVSREDLWDKPRVLISCFDPNFPGNKDPWSHNVPGNYDFEVLISWSPNLPLHRSYDSKKS